MRCVSRSEEHTSALQSHRDLHSFPTRRSSDLKCHVESDLVPMLEAIGHGFGGAVDPNIALVDAVRFEIGRAHVCTPVTQRSTLFPYTTLFRSQVPRRVRSCSDA